MKGILWIKVSADDVKPKYSTVHNHHITVGFGIESIPELIGRTVSVSLLSEHDDGTCQCVKVDYDDEDLKKIQNRQPHITISCVEGVKPVHSNEVVKTEGVEMVGSLTGVVEFVPFK